MKIVYLDCFSGISGDMTLGALLDLGVSQEALLAELGELPVSGYSFHIAQEKRGAIGGTRVRIDIGHQPSRDYADIRALIESSGLEAPVKAKSLAVFEKLAQAEARVHQVPVADVHFHEVGALDSILDIVGAAAALHLLGVDRVCASRIPLGGGTVKTHHGVLPVPAPATVRLLEGIPVYDNGIPRELVTPTGAALLAALCTSYGRIPEMTLLGSGYGIGSHPASDPPNALRIILGEAKAPLLQRHLLLAETHIDDMNPELYNYVFERLFDAGALDVGLISMQMKKGRPGALLRVLFEPALQPVVLETLFRETTTLGARIQEVMRVELRREMREIVSPYGPCRVKWVVLPDGEERLIPEYEECRRLALQHGAPLRKVYEAVQLAAAGYP